MGKSLVIVESPTKARTISKFLGKDYLVESSIGHIRDLPQTAKEIPAKLKKEPWARLGIDIDNDFEPLYVVPADKKKQVSKLRELLAQADVIYLATDEDREGESISWHLIEVLAPKVPQKRLVFHEITKSAIQKALDNPRELDRGLVQAQETRRLLDRLYGYEVSPLLWKKIKPRLSAGRVQSVAVRMVVERERERIAFVRSTYWDLSAEFETLGDRDEGAVTRFPATLVEVGGKRVASGKDFDENTGALKDSAKAKVVHLDEAQATELLARLTSSDWKTLGVDKKPYTSRPAPPFTTSTLQQEANRKLRLSARETMRVAQRLYENGHITYMRTDSVTLSDEAVKAIRARVTDLYGADHLAKDVIHYKTKVKNAQEAHEAIRPSSAFSKPDELRSELSDQELKLYELIWKRTVACQMAEARGHRIVIQIGDGHATFQTSGKTIEFAGFLRAYVEGADDPDAELADKEILLPALEPGDAVKNVELVAKDHTTQPPARYTEASLVKELEASGVGRPSTYASIIDTILRREYVLKQGNALVPTFVAFAVIQLLERFFERLVDVNFTANMESDLDEISLGHKDSLPYLKAFYFGTGSTKGLKELLQSDIDPRESCTLPLGEHPDGGAINIRVGRYGPYLEHGEDRASIPEKMSPDELTLAKAVELLEKGSGPRELGDDPESGRPVFVRVGRFGPYVQLGDKDDEEKPKMKSLLPGMEPEEVTLEAALQLLTLPRNLGPAPDGEEDVLVDYGRFGPYIKRGEDTRSLKEGDEVFTLTMERAVELLAEPGGSWRSRLKPQVLKDLGVHPGNGLEVKVLSGRYGPYVTDSELNASLPKGEDPATLTLERAVEILVQREENGGRRKKAKKKGAKKAAKKKTTKKAVAKKAASKSVTKKTATKKRAATKPATKKTGAKKKTAG